MLKLPSIGTFQFLINEFKKGSKEGFGPLVILFKFFRFKQSMRLRRVCKSFHRLYERKMREKIEKKKEFRWIRSFMLWPWMKPETKDRFVINILETYHKEITKESVFEYSYTHKSNCHKIENPIDKKNYQKEHEELESVYEGLTRYASHFNFPCVLNYCINESYFVSLKWRKQVLKGIAQINILYKDSQKGEYVQQIQKDFLMFLKTHESITGTCITTFFFQCVKEQNLNLIEYVLINYGKNVKFNSKRWCIFQEIDIFNKHKNTKKYQKIRTLFQRFFITYPRVLLIRFHNECPFFIDGNKYKENLPVPLGSTKPLKSIPIYVFFNGEKNIFVNGKYKDITPLLIKIDDNKSNSDTNEFRNKLILIDEYEEEFDINFRHQPFFEIQCEYDLKADINLYGKIMKRRYEKKKELIRSLGKCWYIVFVIQWIFCYFCCWCTPKFWNSKRERSRQRIDLKIRIKRKYKKCWWGYSILRVILWWLLCGKCYKKIKKCRRRRGRRGDVIRKRCCLFCPYWRINTVIDEV